MQTITDEMVRCNFIWRGDHNIICTVSVNIADIKSLYGIIEILGFGKSHVSG